MKKDQIVILKNRGAILISGDDARDFLQNIVTNDIKKVTSKNSVFSAILSPQGKYLSEFFIIQIKKGYLLDCDGDSTSELITNLKKYKLRSDVNIEDLSRDFVIGIISTEKFKNLQTDTRSNDDTINYRDTPIFLDPRRKELGARIFSKLDKLYLTIKKLQLKIVNELDYYSLAFSYGIPEKGLINLKNQLFGLEANFEQLNAIDFKKGCFVGQENTARIKLKNKLSRRLFPLKVNGVVQIGNEIHCNEKIVGKILIDKPFPFALIKLNDHNLKELKQNKLFVNNVEVNIINSYE